MAIVSRFLSISTFYCPTSEMPQASLELETMRSRAAKILLVITAMLSLSLSAVAACACTHHRTAKKANSESQSCHSASHETSTADLVASDPGSPTFDELCNCFLRRAESAITAKSEIKWPKNERTPIAIGRANDANAAENVSFPEDQMAFAFPNLHTQPLRHSGPARAPPRL